MSTDDFLYEEKGAIARVTLNRPAVLNAITFEIYEKLHDTFSALAQRRHLRAVVLTGSGRAFCTGGDVRSIIGRLTGSSDRELLAFTKLTCDVVLKMREAPQPIIASLNGTTAGAGAALALASDIRIAAESARIAFLFVKVGLSGADMGAAHLLPRLIGFTRATEMLMRGEFVDARTAEQWGLYNRVVPADALEAETQSWAEALAAGPQEGLEVTKRVLNRGLGFDLAEALDVEAREQARCMKHPDFREAYEAFVQKRKPAFRGSSVTRDAIAQRVRALHADLERPEPAPGDHAAEDAAARGALAVVARAGLLELLLPAAGAPSVASICDAREELARLSGLADVMFVMQGLGSAAIALAGTPEIRQRWLPGIGRGDEIAAIGLTEPEAGSDLGGIATRAERQGDTYLLNGAKSYISNAGIAGIYAIVARTGSVESGREGLTAFAVPAGTDGLTVRRRLTVSAPHPIGELALDGCCVPASHRLGEEGEGFEIAMRVLDRFRPTVGAAACGFAARALEESLSRARTRRQFGRELAQFQAIQFKLADMAVTLDAARLLVMRAAQLLDAGAPQAACRSASAMAKLYATEAAQQIADEAVQIHGGLGVTRGHIVERLYREVRALRIYEGTSEIQRLVIAHGLLKEPGS